MRNSDPPSDEELEEDMGAPDQGPRFDELMMLVFSGPICFKCLEGAEVEDTVLDVCEGDGSEKSK